MQSGFKRKNRNSLFQKYISYFTFIEILTFASFGIVLFYFVGNTWEAQEKQQLYSAVLNFSDMYVKYAENEIDDEQLNNSLSGAANSVNAIVFVTDLSGNVILCSDCSEKYADDCPVHADFKIPGEIITGVLTDGSMATKSDFNGLFDSEHFISASVAQNINENDMYAVVFAVQSVEIGLTPYRAEFLQIYISAALVFVVVTWLITYFSTYRLTKPLRSIVDATHHYSGGDFSYRTKTSQPGSVREFEDLYAAINSMADSLQKLENSRSEFVANVSHELKTPMTTIGGFIDGILDGTIDSEHQTQYLKVVSDEVKRLSRLVVSMLNMSKIEAGELRINPSNINLSKLIMTIFFSFEQEISTKHIDVKGLDNLKSVFVEADADMLNQVFYNLVDNAVKFTQYDGEISVKITDDEDFAVFSIRNTGKTIAPGDIDHIFERFFKADKSRSMDTKSAGLGLFITKNIMELHNGEISVRNIGDKYTEFTVNLRKKLQ